MEAVLIDDVSSEEVESAEAVWQPFLAKELDKRRRSPNPSRGQIEHSHWDWRTKYEATEGSVVYRMFGVECRREMQGLMLVSTAGHPCRAEGQKGKEQVYIDFVATAPWNSPTVFDFPRYGLVGRVLIATAIQLSFAEEFRGRIGLHALPQAETFYSQKCGMNDLGRDIKKQGLRYFEMTEIQADKFLEGGV